MQPHSPQNLLQRGKWLQKLCSTSKQAKMEDAKFTSTIVEIIVDV